MPIYALTEALAFPPVEMADPDGLLAVGGDLSVERLLLAYRSGIFPWYGAGLPILWHSPDPRFVLFPDELKVSKSMARVVKSGRFSICYDTAFARVIECCRSAPRPGERGTWITAEMVEAYCRLHEAGYAHSVEAWADGQLAGGLYGVSLGGCFFGESMYAKASNASKTALIDLAGELKSRGFALIDCQVYTRHLASLGAKHIARSEFLRVLGRALRQETRRGSWNRRNPSTSTEE